MAYDEEIADRIREALQGVDGVTEKAMFGGLGFMVDGHMAIAAAGKGGIMARVDPTEGESLVERPGVAPMEMKGRGLTGWLRVDGVALEPENAMQEWADRGVAYVRALPPKAPKK